MSRDFKIAIMPTRIRLESRLRDRTQEKKQNTSAKKYNTSLRDFGAFAAK